MESLFSLHILGQDFGRRRDDTMAEEDDYKC